MVGNCLTITGPEQTAQAQNGCACSALAGIGIGIGNPREIGEKVQADRLMVSLLLVDDNAAFRASIRTLLDLEPDLRVLGEAADGPTAIQLISEFTPDIVIMDVVMPDQSGIEATRQIVSTYPAVQVLALSMYADKRFVSAMRTAGASGYVLKDQVFQELTAAIRAVGGGQTYFCPGVADGK
jgi:DNA-binding NarL/FixJ family response regulator